MMLDHRFERGFAGAAVVLVCAHCGDALPVIDGSALSRVLEHGRMYFEEIDNGTRLRMIGQRHASAALRARLDAVIASG